MFNPDLPVTKLPVFRAVLILGGLLTLGTTGAIVHYTGLSWCFTATCFNNLLEFFKVPIRLLAATLSIIGLIALAHRSEQSAKQIKLSEEQNFFSNHYKNKEEFWKYIETSSSRDCIKKHASTYDFIFPNSQIGDYSIAPLFTKSEKKCLLKSLNSLLPEMSREALENRDEIIDELKEGLSKNKYCKEIFSYHIFNKTIDYYLEEQDFHEFLVFFISSLSLAIKTYVEILKFLPSHYKEDHEAIAAHFHETVSDPVALSHFNEEYMRQGIKLIDNVL